MSASWDGIPDPASESFVVGSIDGPWRGSTLMSLAEARRARRGVIGPAECVFAWVDGRHVRVPDGDPPKPAPVITVDGVEVEPWGWVPVAGPSTPSTRAEAQRLIDSWRDGGGPQYRLAAVVLLPEEGT